MSATLDACTHTISKWSPSFNIPVMQAVLAAIIWVALYGMFSQVTDIWKYFKLSVWDMVRYFLMYTYSAYWNVLSIVRELMDTEVTLE